MSKGPKARGYTLIEAMVSTVLVTVGLIALLGAYTNLTRNQNIAVQTERMQRLAVDKYQELVATEALQTQALNGDFSDRGEDSYLWEATVGETGVQNLSALTVTVTLRDSPDDKEKAVVNGVVYQQPQTTTGNGGATGGGQ
ncbi:MAG TPA: prepilin-type N-terminal cleavage/methylation domain-containing protein [Fimbriimonadaceae bacterium]|nr:prepilin-type N-terminal cleavage/methylation domain-containing protein [Fimbriimonadaceae bacterium]